MFFAKIHSLKLNEKDVGTISLVRLCKDYDPNTFGNRVNSSLSSPYVGRT